jgi:hypothetical protein
MRRSEGRAHTIMKSETERRRARRAVKTLGRLVFTTLGPLTLSLLFASYNPPAHAVTITVVGTPGVDGTGEPGGDATATTPANSDPRRSLAFQPMEVAQTPKQAVSLATRSRSLPPQQAETEPLMAAPPPYRAAASVRQFLAVRLPAALSPYQVLRLVVTAGAGFYPVAAHLLA